MVLNINLFQYRANLSNTRSSCHVTLGSKAKTEKKKWIQLIFYYKNQKFSIFPMLVSVSSHVERLRNVQNKERESEKPWRRTEEKKKQQQLLRGATTVSSTVVVFFLFPFFSVFFPYKWVSDLKKWNRASRKNWPRFTEPYGPIRV